MVKDRQIIVSKSLLQREEIKRLSSTARVVLLALAMEIDENEIIYFPGWKSKDYGMGMNNFYNGMRELKNKGFIEPVEGTQSQYRMIDGWEKSGK